MFDKDMEVEEKRLALVDWLNSVVPHFYLSLKATDEELRASLVDGVALCQILNKLKTGSVDEGADRLQSPECRTERIRRFLTAVAEMGLPTFEKSNLENGSMKPVLDCLSALKEQSMPHFVGAVAISSPDRRRGLSDSKFQRSMNSPLVSESLTTQIPGGHKFHEVFQLKPGLHADLPATKISELMRSNSLDNAPTQSLLSVVNGILDESIERRNTEIPQRVACLLRKAVQEIERRISTQAEHLRTQSNLFKAREEKYQSRIRVLEALATGTSEESEIVMNQLQYIKEEKNWLIEKKRLEDGEVDKLKKENYQSNVEISSLKQELELAEKKHELHYLEMETQAKLAKGDLEQRLKEQEQLLEDSKKKLKELEVNADSKCQRWIQIEHKFKSFMHVQYEALQELRHSSEAVRKEVSKTQKSYIEELNSVGKKLKGLAEAAQKYHAVLYENRKIYNELQDLKGNIRVYCRIRPFLPGEHLKETVVEKIGEDGEITISNPSRKDCQKSFRFNKVYDPTATQAKVFSDTQPLIRTVLDGYNVCIFAYGQTGSGKTYTMTGPEEASKDDWGVNYRALDDLFQISEDRRNYFKYEIGVQMIEIYNETIQDLLSSDGSRKKLGILAASQPSGLVVPDASMHPVGSISDVINLMTIGLQNRSVGSTAMNERSSRSHSIVTIYVQGTDLKTGASTRGTLHLVDLAGSERVDRSEATGDRLREAQHINKSLSALGDVIFALAQKSPHVPYRNSKLTQVLQSSLGGRAKTLMFVQVNPDMCSYSETFSTLKFAERVSGVELGAARSNKDGSDVKELMDQVASLKDMIARKDEEIERLQLLKDSKSPRPAVKRSLSSLRHGSSASPTSSIGGSPQLSPTMHNGKHSGIQKAAYEQDSHSETDESLRSSKSMSDLKHDKDSPRVKKLSGGELGSEEDDSEERLSEISDGDIYMENENDGVLGANILTKSSKQTDKLEENSEKTRTTRLSSPRSRVVGATPSRLSQVKTNLRTATAFKKSASGTSSPVTPARRWT